MDTRPKSCLGMTPAWGAARFLTFLIFEPADPRLVGVKDVANL